MNLSKLKYESTCRKLPKITVKLTFFDPDPERNEIGNYLELEAKLGFLHDTYCVLTLATKTMTSSTSLRLTMMPLTRFCHRNHPYLVIDPVDHSQNQIIQNT